MILAEFVPGAFLDDEVLNGWLGQNAPVDLGLARVLGPCGVPQPRGCSRVSEYHERVFSAHLIALANFSM
jgi:hypothetical protein